MPQIIRYCFPALEVYVVPLPAGQTEDGVLLEAEEVADVLVLCEVEDVTNALVLFRVEGVVDVLVDSGAEDVVGLVAWFGKVRMND